MSSDLHMVCSLTAWVACWLQVYLILDEFMLGGEFEETSKKVSSQSAAGSAWAHAEVAVPQTATDRHVRGRGGSGPGLPLLGQATAASAPGALWVLPSSLWLCCGIVSLYLPDIKCISLLSPTLCTVVTSAGHTGTIEGTRQH